MIILWLFAALCGVSVFLYSQVFWHLTPLYAFLLGLAIAITIRGLFTYVRRTLILRERVADDADLDARTVETNRYIFWRRLLILGILFGIYLVVTGSFMGIPPADALAALPQLLLSVLGPLVQLLFLMVANFSIFFGPFLIYGRMGRETVEPGDANYEVRIEDVRGQKSAVQEMVRILKLIDQGRNYVRAGGKRERGVLMVGPPGTGKTMLAKGIATTLRTPIIITSGASFAGMFLGMDVANVFMMVRAAKKKAKRWGGCAIFIDEFDALGSRRSGMGGGGMLGGMGGMMGGGQMGLNMLLVLMDGVDNPGFIRKAFRRLVNITLDGLFVPRQLKVNDRVLSFRIPQLRPPRYNLLFMGATNRPSVLDEAVTRPGRFGRTITFRMPSREDRKDIAALYFDRKAHDAELDSAQRRDEFARVTEGYSPAMIEQALSLALMYAFEDGRERFTWRDLRESMGNIEAGLAEAVQYNERDKVAVARHELGHAVAARFFLPDQTSVRLSIRMRSGSLGHHRAVDQEEQFVHFRSQLAGELRHTLGAIASERVFYGENSSGVTMDLIMATNLAARMVGMYGMGPDRLDAATSRKAANIGEYLVSRVEATPSLLETGGSVTGAALQNPIARRTVAQVLGSAYIDDWRVMHANQEAIDMAAEALIAQGELIGDEVGGLLDSVGLREVRDSDPYPDETPFVPPAVTDSERPPLAAAGA